MAEVGRLNRLFLGAALALTTGVIPGISLDVDADGARWRVAARPSPLTAAEEGGPAAQLIARRFNPAMAFPTRDIWPVDVAYAWHDGADVVARVVTPTGEVLREYVAVPHAELGRARWDRLPARDADGNRIQYMVDAPGDDRSQSGVTAWRQRWRAIMGEDTPDRSAGSLPYPPTQYAHLFWLNRAEGLLAVQYWFYYPWNEWINRHEGDWEHVDVVLQGPSTLGDGTTFRPVGYQFYFHGWSYEPPEVLRVRGADAPAGDDHVVVFAGGRGRLLGWGGAYSGGSYPLAGWFPAVGAGKRQLRPGEDTRHPQRYIAAHDFKVVVLPEPERLDAETHPQLSWLRLDFYAGQRTVFGNPFFLDWLRHGSPPLQPGHHSDWNTVGRRPSWRFGKAVQARTVELPASWQVIARPPGPLTARLP